MDPALANLGWTEDNWNRICTTVTEEAQKARVAANVLPCVGPENPTTVAMPNFSLEYRALATPNNQATKKLVTNSDPELYLTRVGVNIELRSHEAADPTLNAALGMFRRAANVIARVEDALLFYGRRNTAITPTPASALNAPRLSIIPPIYDFTNDRHNVPGIFPYRMGPSVYEPTPSAKNPPLKRGVLLAPTVDKAFQATALQGIGALGDGVVNAIIAAINSVEGNGYPGPFACVLGSRLFEAICTPAPSLVLPRDRVLPFVQGPLVRSSAIDKNAGVVISLAGSPVEVVMASDLKPRFLQQTENGRLAFRVSEKVAVRVKDAGSVQWISY
jgi:uncharacterized linocin/CFP29 family protein